MTDGCFFYWVLGWENGEGILVCRCGIGWWDGWVVLDGWGREGEWWVLFGDGDGDGDSSRDFRGGGRVVWVEML